MNTIDANAWASDALGTLRIAAALALVAGAIMGTSDDTPAPAQTALSAPVAEVVDADQPSVWTIAGVTPAETVGAYER